MLKAHRERDKTWNETLREGSALGNQFLSRMSLLQCCTANQEEIIVERHDKNEGQQEGDIA